jgi:MSHA biogenesis protein MshQ
LIKAVFHRVPIVLALSGLAAILCVQCANASSLSGDLTADNAFYAYISTDNTVLGTLVAQGGNWGATSTFSNFILTPGQTYYLQVEAINYGGPGALIGQFDLSDTGFQFANGSQTMLTDTTDWLAVYNNANSDPNAQQPWVTPTGSVYSLGTNGVGPWGTVSGIDGNADWIDATVLGLSDCQFCTVDFSTPITSDSSTAPEPGTLGLLGGALTGFLALARRRVIR